MEQTIPQEEEQGLLMEKSPPINQREPGVEQIQEEEPAMDPQTQEQFDIFVANGLQIIYSQEESAKIMQAISDSENPVTIIARITLRVVNQLEDMLTGQGVEISDDAKIHGANILMGEIMTMAEKAGINPLSEEERNHSWSMAVALYIDEGLKSGRLSPEQIQEMSERAQQTPEGQEIARKMQGWGQQPMPEQYAPEQSPQTDQFMGGM